MHTTHTQRFLDRLIGQTNAVRKAGGGEVNDLADKHAARIAVRVLSGEIPVDTARRAMLGLLEASGVMGYLRDRPTRSRAIMIHGSAASDALADEAEQLIIERCLGVDRSGALSENKNNLNIDQIAHGASLCGWARRLGVMCLDLREFRAVQKSRRVEHLVDDSDDADDDLSIAAAKVRQTQHTVSPHYTHLPIEDVMNESFLTKLDESRKPKGAHKRENMKYRADAIRMLLEMPPPPAICASEMGPFVVAMRNINDDVAVRAVPDPAREYVEAFRGHSDTMMTEVLETLVADASEPSAAPSKSKLKVVSLGARESLGLSTSDALVVVASWFEAAATGKRVNNTVQPKSDCEMASAQAAFLESATCLCPDVPPQKLAAHLNSVLYEMNCAEVEQQRARNVSCAQ